jgi:hypothetical protein
MNYLKFLPFLFLFSLWSCIGDDIVDDFVEPQIRFIISVDTIGVGETSLLEVQFFNNIGIPEQSTITWASSNDEIAMVSPEGLLWARQKGEVVITASTEYNGQSFSEEKLIVVDEETVETPTERTGSLKTTSSYALQGDFILTRTETGVNLAFADNYETDDVLPGLYIYLTNNPSTVRDALVIGEVTIFKGEHEYQIDDVSLNDYSHVLYFCKPFNVKVGDGAFE